jgi:endonuclease III
MRRAASGFGRRYPRHTGRIWTANRQRRTAIVTAVTSALARSYPRTRLNNPAEPVDDLIFIIVSNRSSAATAHAVFRNLKSRYRSWNSVADDRKRTKLVEILRPLGMAVKKATLIVAALRKIRRDFGRVDLQALRHWPTSDAEAYLTTLPGVSSKVAKCVLMYAFRREVLPVDVHVHRVATRLGWIARKRADQSHEELEELIAPPLRRRFHINAIQHGRLVCRPTRPDCASCAVRAYCARYQTYGR